MMKRKKTGVLWGLMSLAMSGYLGFNLTGGDRALFLMGETTQGHHQIEMACPVCHKRPFGGEAALQEACMDCHGAELKQVDDSHPKSKFTDPRNAERVANLDARLCIACHKEHRPRITGPMGLSLPSDFCFHCHPDVAKDRPSHQDLPFDTCASAGCHNFHDNRALYEDFLLKHADAPDLLPLAKVAVRKNAGQAVPVSDRPVPPLGPRDADAPPGAERDAALMAEWAETAHAQNGVNCRDCHAVKNQESGLGDGQKNRQEEGQKNWTDKPDEAACKGCHDGALKGFLSGKHGMRLASGLPRMRPALARRPMKEDARDKPLGCVSCHGAHAFNTRKAAAAACLACHDDEHSRAYPGSPHDTLFQNETQTADKAGTGVSCATCHMPREIHREEGVERVRVQHNQNGNLRPNEKMIREVCLNCHGLRFSIDALADAALMRSNFSRKPRRRVESIDWAKRRTIEKDKQKEEPRHEPERAVFGGERNHGGG